MCLTDIFKHAVRWQKVICQLYLAQVYTQYALALSWVCRKQKGVHSESGQRFMNYPRVFSAAFTFFCFSKRPSVTFQTSRAHCLSWSLPFSQMETEQGKFTQLQNVEVEKQTNRKINFPSPTKSSKEEERLTLLLAMDIRKKQNKTRKKKTVQSSVLPQKKLQSLPSVQF